MKLISVIIGALFLQSGIALAAAPNLVGTWEPVSGYWSATGTESNPAPAEQFQTRSSKVNYRSTTRENF